MVVNSASAPVIFTDQTKTNVIASGQMDSLKLYDPIYLKETLAEMASQNQPIEIHLSENETHYLFYSDSYLLNQLKYFPILQFVLIGMFLIIAYWLFSVSRKTEQNQVWVGMAKETAHQLGTPLSSLIAWMEIFRSQGIDESMILEIEKDIARLQTITERFSKIGSAPKLENESLKLVIEDSIKYLKTRSSNKIIFSTSYTNEAITAKVNIPLFEWVLENLCRNAIDSMEGSGSISIQVSEADNLVVIDVTDTGKGIPSSKHKTVFQPGYTTKKRGWGLGLSLTKRIIEMYHSGKIFVKKSEMNVGTTFRILLNK